MKKIGIYGGSFNPIHTGHISLAKQIINIAKLDEVWFVVSPQNPFKQNSLSLISDEIRLELTRKALEGEQQLKVSDCEFHLPRPSYMWHTLLALSSQHPDAEFNLIIGADNWAVFDKWYHATDIIQNHKAMETQEIRKYPVGMQTFVDIINDNYICRQDKTQIIMILFHLQ